MKTNYNNKASLYDNALSGETLPSKLLTKIAWGIKNAHEIEELLNFINDDFGGKLLDLPCGTGLFTAEKYARMANADITAVDYSVGMIARAKERFAYKGIKNVQFMQGDVVNLPFEGATFDAVLCMNGLPCFPDKQRSLPELVRVLKPDGVFVGCSYVRNQRAVSDLIVGKIYPLLRFTVPPFFTKSELIGELGQYFKHIKVKTKGSIVMFVCKETL